MTQVRLKPTAFGLKSSTLPLSHSAPNNRIKYYDETIKGVQIVGGTENFYLLLKQKVVSCVDQKVFRVGWVGGSKFRSVFW